MGGCFSSAKPKPQSLHTEPGGKKLNGKEKIKSSPKKRGPKPLKRKTNGRVPLGKLTDFGYSRDFKQRYQQGKLLGHGQFGYTYVATNIATGEKVAAKTIEKKQMLLPIAVEDVKREVKILQTLSGHDNIVQFYEAFEDDDYIYIVMELCEGGE
eukprot:c25250_g2_i1 orf=594-1055(+)